MKCSACGEDKPKEEQEYYHLGLHKIPKPCKACIEKAQTAMKNYPVPDYMRKQK